MKILLIADEPDKRLWDNLDRTLLEDIELVISCGDLPASYLSFLTCFTDAPILYVHGNHDARYETHPPEGCICIEDTIYDYKGLRILGLGGSMRYKPGPHQYTDKEMLRRIRKLWFRLWRSKGVDIVVSHAPVLHHGDGDDLCHRGFDAFRWLIEKYMPAYHVHGHMHKDYTHEFKREHTLQDTCIVNAWMRYVIDVDVDAVRARAREKHVKKQNRT